MDSTNVTATAEQEFDEIEVLVNNVICNFRAARSIDLKELARTGNNLYYDPALNCVRMESQRPKFFATIWQSGKVVCAGSKDMDQAYYNAKYITKLFLNFGIKAKLRNYKIINVLATLTLPYKISLYRLDEFVKELVFKPEQGGAKLKMPEFDACFKIFTTGKATLMTTNMEFLYQAIEKFSDIMYKFAVSSHKKSIKM